ncbi:MAG: hypothetical protein AAF798_08335 [Bacteroidota bacterium]
MTVIPPATCSDVCAIEAAVSNIVCDPNGTLTDPSDDQFTFTVLVSGANTGSNGWQAFIGGQAISGSYNTPVQVGPFPIADGALSFTIRDVDDQSCATGLVTVTPPATCSSVCEIVATVSDVICDPNSTDSDASDDTFTFLLTVSGMNTGSNGWQTIIDGQTFSGSYNIATEVGPFPIAGGTLNFTIQDADDPGCATSVVTVSPPMTCSDICEIEAFVDPTSIVVNDNGTPANPFDDTFLFIVNVTGNNTGGTWTANDPNNTTGNYDEPVVFGPYDVCDPDLEDGIALLVSIVDGDDPDCVASFRVELDESCFDACVIAIDVDPNTIVCDNNGTADPSDDTFTFQALVTGSNTSGIWVANDPNNSTGNYGLRSFGPYPIAAGAVSFQVFDGTIGSNCVTEVVTVQPPATCSVPDCAITATIVSDPICDPNGTTFDSSDDTFSFIVNVSGTETGTGWIATINGQEVSGSYDTEVELGPYDIAAGDLTITFRDNADADCTFTLDVPAPQTCSDLCDVGVQIVNVKCNDEGTTDPSDDTFTFQVLANGEGLDGLSWTATDPDNTTGTFGTLADFGPYLISDGDVTFTIMGDDNSLCIVGVYVTPPPSCSEPPCTIELEANDIVCFDNNTPFDSTDDTYTFNLTVTAENASAGWFAESGELGFYGQTIAFGPFPIAGGDQTIVITDFADELCSAQITVPAPPTCSDDPPPVCEINANILNIECADNGTPFDASDDTYTVEVVVTGTDIGPNWTATDSNGGQLSGDYNVPTTFGPYPIAGGNVSISFTDANDSDCTASVDATAPPTCSDDCEIDAVVTNVLCDDNGTPNDATDDTFTFDVTVTGNGTGSGWTANDLASTSGQYGVPVSFGPYLIADGMVNITITDNDKADCVATVSVDGASTLDQIECPEDTDEATFTEEPVQIIPGAITTDDLVFEATDSLCWWSEDQQLGDRYYDAIQFKTTENIASGTVYTFTLYTDMDAPPIIDGSGAIFKGELDLADLCCGLLAGGNAPYQIDGAPIGNPMIPNGIGTNVTPVLQLNVRLEPGAVYTLLTTTWLPEQTGSYAWVVFSQSDEPILDSNDTAFDQGTATVTYDMICDDVDSILDNPMSTDWTGTVDVSGICGFDNLTFDDELLAAEDCDDVTIVRTFTVTDVVGNTATCDQQITIRKPVLEDVNAPAFAAMFDCGDNFQTDANGNPHPAVTGYPFVLSAFGATDLAEAYCNLQATYDDERMEMCPDSYELHRTWTVTDICNTDEVVTFKQLIKVGDFEAPVVECPTSNHYCPIVEGDIMLFSTDPWDCTGTVEVPLPDVTDNCSDWTVVTQIVTLDDVVLQTINEDDPRIVTGLELGDYFFRYIVTDECGNETIQDCRFRIADLVEPTAVCFGSMNVSIGGFGLARLFTYHINNNSYDNCGIDSVQIRRLYTVDPETCEPVTPYYSDWGPFVEFTCCDVNQFVTVELRVVDEAGNANMCWLEVLVEDKTAPQCYGLEDLTADCNDLPAGFDPFNLGQLDTLFGYVKVFDNCAAETIAFDPIVEFDECGLGTITRRFLAVDGYGNYTVDTFRQVVTIQGVQNYEIMFPRDAQLFAEDCEVLDTIIFNEIGCDLLAVSINDTIVDPLGDECYRIERVFNVINWCEYDGVADPVVISRDEDCDGIEGDENVWVLRRPTNTFIDRDSAEFNLIPLAGTKDTICDMMTNPDGYWKDTTSTGFWRYTQYIDVFDDMAPIINFTVPEPICIDEENCEGYVEYPFSIEELCMRDTIIRLEVFLDAFANDTLDVDLVEAGAVQFGYPNFRVVGEFPIGSHEIVVIAEDQCGNEARAELPFEVVDCAVAAPDCYNGFVLDLLRTDGVDVDGDGDIDRGMAMIMADMLVESMADDCSGPLTFSINRVGELPSINQNSLILTCDDLSEVQVEVFVWDSAFNPYAMQPDSTMGGPNFNHCISTITLQDGNDVCQEFPDGDLTGEIDPENSLTIGDEEVYLINKDQKEGDQRTESTQLFDDERTQDGRISKSEMPFELFQNKPNPFRERTVISFNLPEAEDVTVVIRDAAGRTLMTIEDQMSAGYQEVAIDNGKLPQGLLYYTVIAGDHFATKRMVHLE